MEWEKFTCAYRILKQLMGKFTSQCSTLFSLLRVLDAGSISDMPLIIQIIVCIVCFISRRAVYYLNTACQNCVCLSRRADGTHGRCAREQPDSPQRRRKSKGKREGGEGTPWHDNHALISAEQPIWLYCGTKKADRLHMFWCISMPRLHKAIDEYQC